MYKQSFSEKNLIEVRTQRQYKSKVFKQKNDLPTLADTSASISEGSYISAEFDNYFINKKPVYCTASKADEVVFSKLNHNIRGLYRVKQSDRHSIVKQVMSLLKEESPKYVYKFDIKDFYKNVDVNSCLTKIQNDQVVSAESEIVFKEFVRQLKNTSIEGLPRGIGLSATLSELAMRDFDQKMMSHKNVYYYSRYVDDILIFALEKIDIKSDLISFLPKGLELNWGKTKVLEVKKCLCQRKCLCASTLKVCKCFAKCKCKLNTDSKQLLFDFLGYSFSFPSLAKSKSSDWIKIDLSISKAKKLKRRLYLSFKSYIDKGNSNLLENRIKFLTGNHYIPQYKNKTDRMKSGVYYNYIHINEPLQYKELDSFLSTLIRRDYGKRIFLSPQHKKALIKYSFLSGFKSKRLCTLNGVQINKIKGCW
ncbi:MAG: hypothetical protein JKX78_14560 [Alteromonadaceae bacterium]|nr:hypothetical protein [Alteromonadaceae bacterium]